MSRSLLSAVEWNAVISVRLCSWWWAFRSPQKPAIPQVSMMPHIKMATPARIHTSGLVFFGGTTLGGMLGGAFGRIAQLLLHDPRIDPGAFALVGMGTFYGGIAHVPVSSLIDARSVSARSRCSRATRTAVSNCAARAVSSAVEIW